MTEPAIVFEDTHLAVVEKPAGLLTQGDSSGEPSLVDWLRAHFGRNYVGLIHRLDRNTSGLIVIAKRSKSANRLTESLQSGELKRAYLAWLHGELRQPARWEHLLLKDESTNTVSVVKQKVPGAKSASLQVEPVGKSVYRGSPITLARFDLETGRSHQIRVQAAAAGYPLVGDPKYGRPDGFHRPALHSAWISFPHPMGKAGDAPLEFKSEMPTDLATLDPKRAP